MMNLAQKQILLSRDVILEDRFRKRESIGGISNISTENGILCSFVVCSYPEMKLIDKSVVEFRTSFPYIPGFLVFREGPPIILAYEKLKKRPDLIMIKASGICHPRFFGMASHIGLLLQKPTIGITERALCGEAKNGKIFYRGRQVGWKLKNIYISPGYKVSLESSLEIVKNCMRGHKLPEPLYLAHQYVKHI